MIAVDEEMLRAASENALAARQDFLSPMGPMILASAAMGIARDSRSFARFFEVAHALVIRECVYMSEEQGLLKTEDRGDLSQRLFFDLTETGWSLLPEELFQ
ncbi:MAG: hypothetical protein AAGG56_04190 [Pseudomonadota bacterium]